VKVEPNVQKDISSSVDRFEEIRGKFAPNVSIKGRRSFLVDDVMTSGATLSECARMCTLAGASAVHGLVVGRNFRFLEDREYG
jgi:predicted amidophosphoribosyltransferase